MLHTRALTQEWLMCMACEEADMAYRWQLVEHIAKGEMPPGLTAQDLADLGLPQPAEIEVPREPHATVPYRQRAPSEVRAARASRFVCDAPDSE
jgi:hypothetical protein